MFKKITRALLVITLCNALLLSNITYAQIVKDQASPTINDPNIDNSAKVGSGLSTSEADLKANAASAMNDAIKTSQDTASKSKADADAKIGVANTAKSKLDAANTAKANAEAALRANPGDTTAQDQLDAANAEIPGDQNDYDSKKSIADAAAIKANADADKVTDFQNQQKQLQTDAQNQINANSGSLKGQLNLTLNGPKVDNSRQYADGSKPNITVSDQKMYDDALQADITMVILGSVTTRLKLCPSTSTKEIPDMMMAATAGQAFVTGEVEEYTDLVDLKNQLNTLMKQIVGDPNDKQRQALVLLKQGYERVKAISTTKKQLRQAAQASYLAAADAATAEAAQLATNTQSCTTGIKSKVAKGVSEANMWAMIGAIGCIAWMACSWMGCPMPNYLGVPACGVAVIAYANASSCQSGGDSSVKANNNRKNVCEDRDGGGNHIHDKTDAQPDSMTVSSHITTQCVALKGDVITGAANSGCDNIFASSGKGPYTGCDAADQGYQDLNASCKLGGLSGEHDPNFYDPAQKFTFIKPTKTYMEILSDIFFSAAHAGLLSAMGVSRQKVVDFIHTQMPIFANALDTQLAAPVWRAIAWQALAGLVGDAISATDGMLGQIDSDISKIQQILDALDNHIQIGNNGNTTFGNSTNFVAVPGGVATLPCITNSGAGACKSVSVAVTTTQGFLELPGSVRALGAKVLNVGDSLSGAGSVSSGTLGKINTLNASADAIRADLLKRQQLLQKVMAQNGTQMDMVKESNKFASNLRAITKSGLAAAGSNASEMRSMMSGGSGLSSTNADAQKALDDMKLQNAANNGKNKSGAGFGTGFGALGSSGSKKGGSGKDGNGSDDGDGKNGNGKGADGLTDAERAALLAAQAQAKKAGESTDSANQNTINDDNGYTLFEVITNRYQKSAYPRLFKKIQE